MKQFLATIRRYTSLFILSEKGNVGLTFGAAAVAILALTGVAIDYARAHLVKKEISRALDAAVLAAGTLSINDLAEMQLVADKYFAANLTQKTKDKYNPQVILAVNNDTITGSTSADVDTVLMKLSNINFVTVASTAIAERPNRKVEVVLVLDNTGSMAGAKIDTLQTAATQLVDILYELPGSENFVSIGIVPYNAAVNIGNSMWPTWVDRERESAASEQDYPAGQSYWGNVSYTGMKAYEALDHFGVDWGGCVRTRLGQELDEDSNLVDLDTSDIAPDPLNPKTLWAPLIHPLHGWPASSGDDDDDDDDDGGGTPSLSEIQARLTTNLPAGCAQTEILALTNQPSTIKDTIDAMMASGSTSIPVGLAWGWRLLSPSEPYSQGDPYTAANTTKVIVLLTDGLNFVPDYGNGVDDYYNGYGLPMYGNLSAGPHPNTGELDAKTSTLCDNIKAKAIQIYTITLELDDVPTQDLMRDCATRSDMYYNSPDTSALETAFRKIAENLQYLRLTK